MYHRRLEGDDHGRSRPPPPRGKHHPDARDGRRPEGELRAPRHADGRGRRGDRPLHAVPEAQPREPRLARPRPLRPVRRATARCCCTPPPPLRLRPVARRSQGVPPVGEPDAGPPRVRPDGRASRRRPARSGRASPTPSAWRSPSAMLAARFNRAGPRDRRPPHLRDRRRRRPDGGRLARGGLAGRPPRARQAHRPLRRQPHHHRRPDVRSRSPRTSASASRPTAGTSSASDGHDHDAVEARDRGRAARDAAADADRLPDAHRLRQPEQAGHGARPTARRSATRRSGPRRRRSAGRTTRSSSSPTRSAAYFARRRPRWAAAQEAMWNAPLRGVRAALPRPRPRSSRRCLAGRAPRRTWDATLPAFDARRSRSPRARPRATRAPGARRSRADAGRRHRPTWRRANNTRSKERRRRGAAATSRAATSTSASASTPWARS